MALPEEEPSLHFIDMSVSGSDRQVEFVQRALATPDFALLDGPPGSGKTTVLCEAILGFLLDGKRVLLCSSTNVAVDNIIDKMTEHIPEIIPTRAGSRITSKNAQQYSERNLELMVSAVRAGTYEGEITPFVGQIKRAAHETEQAADVMFGQFVCGTPASLERYICRHSKQNSRYADFDVLIVDEASKMTLLEFLVPARHAKKWILSGDVRQLSPYTDEDELIPNIDRCLDDGALKSVCTDVYLASKHGDGYAVILIADSGADVDADAYMQQCSHVGVKFYDLRGGETHKPKRGSVYLARAQDVENFGHIPRHTLIRNHHILADGAKKAGPMSGTTVQGGVQDTGPAKSFSEIKSRSRSVFSNYEHMWAATIAWQMQNHFKNILSLGAGTVSGAPAYEPLLPAPGLVNRHDLDQKLRGLADMMMTSIMRLLESGLVWDRNGTSVIERGMGSALDERRVLLEYQHRMHPGISKFSMDNVYSGMALKSPDGLAESRSFAYGRYSRRLAWIDMNASNDGSPHGRQKAQQVKEASCIADEVGEFIAWACGPENTRSDKERPWSVGIISFYSVGSAIMKEELAGLRMVPDGALTDLQEDGSFAATANGSEAGARPLRNRGLVSGYGV